MKLAIKAFIFTLLLLTFVFAVSAQPRSIKDDRNTAPTVGTGGAEGGPTGLFTVYDGQTLRKGEYTFSIAYSNYDRDPGDADITEVPISFQIGVTDHLEVFFNTQAWRGIKVNAPRNLSSFYLPNVQLPIGGRLVRGPSIIIGNSGTFNGQAVFNPTGGPVVGYPFYPTIAGVPHTSGGASVFPGIGSPYGSILPGVVLTTSVVNGTEIPGTFSIAPSYLPDAPFISRTYADSSFNTIAGGIKWRINSNDSAVGFGIESSWKWYLDNADDAAGFNMMQRGSGPGAHWGDFSGSFFTDARLSEHINLSGNIGYTFTTNPKFNDFTMIDRPDEVRAAMAADFPVNKYLQFIFELQSVHYIGGHTPNAFERNPLDGIAGLRVFPARWWGFGGAYRANLNQQGTRSFGDTPIPSGFVASTSPSGYIAQLWVGRRHPRVGPVVNLPANVDSVALSATTITLPCAAGMRPRSGSCDDNKTISVATHATDPENDVLTYSYTVSGGRVIGTGANVQWDLSGATPGTYTITTGVDDGCGICGKTNTQTITIAECDCVPACACPTLSVSGPSGITKPGDPMTFVANVTGGNNLTYNWSVSAGTISSGQGTSSITVDTTGLGGQSVTATVELGGDSNPADCNCPKTASETAGVQPLPIAIQVSEFGKKTPDEIKAELDPFFIQLQNDPTAQGYIINYGTPAQIKDRRAVITKAINFRKFPMDRVTFVDGPDTGDGPRTKLWIVPAGATPPAP